ncbi:methyltransferase [Streptomyces sp. NPDC050548]|uniref:methyltransferase n=1 Tax=Streptomyces sp. NPDC050548 TaxID=3365629 RepID=UPI0037A6FE8F
MKTNNGDNVRNLSALQNGHVVTQLISAAVRLHVFDHLADGELTDETLSERTSTDLAVLRRYLSALRALGLVEPAGTGGHRATELGALLRRDSGALYGHALMSGDDYYEAWKCLDHSLRTGRSAFRHRFGQSLWERFADDEEVAAAYTRSMRWNTGHALAEILDLYRFPDSGVVADLGSGDGTLTIGLLSRFPGLRAVVVEQPSVIEHTRRTLTEQGLADRCEFVAGDIRSSVPRGADLYLLKSVIHNFGDDEALGILRTCRDALDTDARLLVVEHTWDTTDALRSAVRDMTMLVLFGSQDRDAKTYADLVERAGLTVLGNEVGPTGICVVESGRL